MGLGLGAGLKLGLGAGLSCLLGAGAVAGAGAGAGGAGVVAAEGPSGFGEVRGAITQCVVRHICSRNEIATNFMLMLSVATVEDLHTT